MTPERIEQIVEAVKAELVRQANENVNYAPYVDTEIGARDTPPTVQIDGDVDLHEIVRIALREIDQSKP